jgi:hypothetical protein
MTETPRLGQLRKKLQPDSLAAVSKSLTFTPVSVPEISDPPTPEIEDAL